MSDFIKAARHGDIARMRLLVEKGEARINEAEKTSKLTALHVAAANKNEATTYVLLTETKADPHMKDAKGRRPIDIAMEIGNQNNIQMLYEATHAKNHLSLEQRTKGERATILPYRTIANHAARQVGKEQDRGR